MVTPSSPASARRHVRHVRAWPVLPALLFAAAVAMAVVPTTRDPWVGKTLSAPICGPWYGGHFRDGINHFCMPGRHFALRVDRLVASDVYHATVTANEPRPDGQECRVGTPLHVRPAFLMTMRDFADGPSIARRLAAAEKADPIYAH